MENQQKNNSEKKFFELDKMRVTGNARRKGRPLIFFQRSPDGFSRPRLKHIEKLFPVRRSEMERVARNLGNAHGQFSARRIKAAFNRGIKPFQIHRARVVQKPAQFNLFGEFRSEKFPTETKFKLFDNSEFRGKRRKEEIPRGNHIRD